MSRIKAVLSSIKQYLLIKLIRLNISIYNYRLNNIDFTRKHARDEYIQIVDKISYYETLIDQLKGK